MNPILLAPPPHAHSINNKDNSINHHTPDSSRTHLHSLSRRFLQLLLLLLLQALPQQTNPQQVTVRGSTNPPDSSGSSLCSLGPRRRYLQLLLQPLNLMLLRHKIETLLGQLFLEPGHLPLVPLHMVSQLR
jgi:hypothetical protein